MLNVTIAAKSKEAYSIFFDDAFNGTTKGKGSFIRPNVGSLYKLGILAGIVLHAVPREMIVLTIRVKGGRDVVAAYNFFDVAEGTKIVANLINVPTNAAGDQIIGAVEDCLADLKAHFGGTKASEKGAAASKKAVRAKKPAAATTPARTTRTRT